jgi:hypothetical protein
MARLFVNNPETPEGKFLVLRRDGTIPPWPYFVMGAADPMVPTALRAYADKAQELDKDPEYVRDILALATRFEEWRLENGEGDPDAPAHRQDLPSIIAIMKAAKGV